MRSTEIVPGKPYITWLKDQRRVFIPHERVDGGWWKGALQPKRPQQEWRRDEVHARSFACTKEADDARRAQIHAERKQREEERQQRLRDEQAKLQLRWGAVVDGLAELGYEAQVDTGSYVLGDDKARYEDAVLSVVNTNTTQALNLYIEVGRVTKRVPLHTRCTTAYAQPLLQHIIGAEVEEVTSYEAARFEGREELNALAFLVSAGNLPPHP